MSSHSPAATALPRKHVRPSRSVERTSCEGPIDFDRPPVDVLPAAPSVLVGRVVALDGAGRPWVESPALPGERVAAHVVAAAGLPAVDAVVVLAFEAGDPRRPIVLGVLATPASPAEVAVQRDEERLVLKAEREIVLECGEASITLTRAGKVIIRGAYLLSRSSGVNRIKGASVQIN